MAGTLFAHRAAAARQSYPSADARDGLFLCDSSPEIQL